MSDHDPSQSSEHPVLLLLPWYLNGTLSIAERQEVDEHLQQCRKCRNELEALSSLAGKMKSSWAHQPAASTELRSRVLSQISRGPVASIADVGERMHRDRTRPPQRRGRSMLQALAASVIVIQFAAILWMMRAPQPEVISRGIVSGVTQIQIVFQPRPLKLTYARRSWACMRALLMGPMPVPCTHCSCRMTSPPRRPRSLQL